ncbi:MAG: ABC transporter permease [Variovorax sp.]
MLRFVLFRLLTAVPLLLAVSLVAFTMLRLVPGDVAIELAGPLATPEELDRIQRQLGLDRPFFEQMVTWYRALAHGDLGQSFLLKRGVTEAIIERLPVTLSLTGLSLLFSVILGVTLGTVAAMKHNTRADQFLMTGALLGLSFADFWLGLALIYALSVAMGWFPSGGYVPFAQSPAAWLWHLTLPAMTLALTQMGFLARMTRSSMLEVLRQDFIRTARAKGVPERLVIMKHALANAMIPVVTVIGLTTGILLSGAVVIEQVFSLPGVGRLIVGSIVRRDYPVVQGALLFTASIFLCVNVLVDVLYAALDPRVRHAD